MPHIIIIERDATLKEYNVKDSVFIEETLYKKIGLKSNNNFERIYSVVGQESASIYLYGKKTGKSNLINAYPFVSFSRDASTIYGNCIMLKLDTASNTLMDFRLDDFAKFLAATPDVVADAAAAADTTKKQRKPRTTTAKKPTPKEIEDTPVVVAAATVAPTVVPTNYEKDLVEEEYIV